MGPSTVCITDDTHNEGVHNFASESFYDLEKLRVVLSSQLNEII